jgi:hypothetical protein
MPDEAWVRRHIGDRIKGKVQVLRGLVAGDHAVVLYAQQEYRPGAREPATGAVRLSVLDGVTERCLWEYENGGAVTSGLVSGPLLAACRFSDVRGWDIFLSVTVDEGVGKLTEHWSRHLYVFPGGNAAGALHIPIAALDMDIHIVNEDPVCSIKSDPSQPALRRDARVIVDPFGGSLVLVAREIRFRSEHELETPPRGEVTVKMWRATDGGFEQRDVPPGDLPQALLNGPTSSYGAGGAGLVLQ